MTDAELCRKNGWKVGTILEGDVGYGPDRIQITAIGLEHILARREFRRMASAAFSSVGWMGERQWTLECRDWKRVGWKLPRLEEE